jgi:Holliday junction resolvase RusA-like endonuclease
MPIRKGGKIVAIRMTDGKDAEAQERSRSWRSLVQDAALQAHRGEMLSGPLRLTLRFYRPRPNGHFRQGKKQGLRTELKSDAPLYPTTRPDTVKLTRAVEDALSKVLWLDDAQVVDHILEKRYGEPARCEVTIESELESRL